MRTIHFTSLPCTRRYNPGYFQPAGPCNVEVRHIRKLADIQKKGKVYIPQWAQIMISRRRKSLVICRDCHEDTHYGASRRKPRNDTGELGAQETCTPGSAGGSRKRAIERSYLAGSLPNFMHGYEGGRVKPAPYSTPLACPAEGMLRGSVSNRKNFRRASREISSNL